MRLLSFILLGASALILSACDDAAPRKAPKGPATKVAEADCCCKDRCPMDRPSAPVVGTPDEEGVVTHRTGGHVRKTVRRAEGGGSSRYSYRYRSGTEGVGYLDEEEGYRGVGYRRVGGSVSVEESESYSESARYSESGSGYSYSRGGGGVVVYDSGGRVIEGRGDGRGGHGRRGGGGYAGIDRDGYLTWPGKTP